MTPSPEATKVVENANHFLTANRDWLDDEVERARIVKLKACQEDLKTAIKDRKLGEASRLFDQMEWLVGAIEKRLKFAPDFPYEAAVSSRHDEGEYEGRL